MKTKRIITFMLCLVLLLTCFANAVSASADSITPRYSNTARVDSNFFISNDVAIVYLSYDGYNGITNGARITTVLQKRNLLVFWMDVTEWVDTSSKVSDSFEHTYAVESGKYRVKITYEISGTGGATDVIEEEFKASN